MVDAPIKTAVFDYLRREILILDVAPTHEELGDAPTTTKDPFQSPPAKQMHRYWRIAENVPIADVHRCNVNWCLAKKLVNGDWIYRVFPSVNQCTDPEFHVIEPGASMHCFHSWPDARVAAMDGTTGPKQ